MSKINKNLSIETLRGIAILLVVLGHVIGSGPSGGMKIDFPHPLRYLYVWIDYIQMPLFTAIAGWVYALKPFSAFSGFGSFTRKKALRLLVPMAAVGTLYFFVQYFMPGTNQKGDLSQLWRIYVFPYTIYWYLPSLFLIFLVQYFIDKKGWMDTLGKWGVLCIIAIVLSRMNDAWLLHDVPNVFSFKGALNQLPYFFAGIAAQRFAVQLYNRVGRIIIFLMALLGILLINAVWFFHESDFEIMQLYPLAQIPTLFLLLSLKKYNRFFVWIGGYAYSIYLFHGFGTSGGRILFKIMGVQSTALIFLFASCIAVLSSIVIDICFSRFNLSRILFLGKWKLSRRLD